MSTKTHQKKPQENVASKAAKHSPDSKAAHQAAKHVLDPLAYSYDSLEPYIDEATMKFHHDKHHQAYIDKLNAALESAPELAAMDVDELMRNMDKVPADIKKQVENHGGGHSNHRFFWTILKKGTTAKAEILDAINSRFGSLEEFTRQFSQAATNVFGSGWSWLVIKNGRLEIVSTPNQNSPLSENAYPLIGIDVWEHAYYLKYQNRRAEYIDAFFKVIDWDAVNARYLQTRMHS